MSIFAPIAKWLRGDARAQKPLFDLSAEQLADLKELQSSRGWFVFMSVLDCSVNLNAEALLRSRDDATVHELRGFINGMRKAPALVAETLSADNERTAIERARLDASKHSNDHERIALYGSPAFRRTGSD